MVTSHVTVSAGSVPNELEWSLECDDGTSLGGGAPIASASPLAVANGAECALTLKDSSGEGWHGSESVGVGRTFAQPPGFMEAAPACTAEVKTAREPLELLAAPPPF